MKFDPTDLRVVALFEKQGEGSWSPKQLLIGFALSKGERAAEKRLPGLVREKLGERITFDAVFQRTNPQRYDAVMNAGGFTEAKATICVLVHRRFEGVAGKLSELVESKVKDFGPIGTAVAKVQIIFERTQPELYADIVEALGRDEEVTDESVAGSAVAGTALGGLTAWLSRRRRRLLPTA